MSHYSVLIVVMVTLAGMCFILASIECYMNIRDKMKKGRRNAR